MRSGQASMEMLLITTGVILTAVVAGYYAISSTAAVYSELNAISDSNNVITGGSDLAPVVAATYSNLGGGSYELKCSATDDVQLSQISIYLDGGPAPEKTCSFSGVSGTCSKTVSLATGSHELNCVAVDTAGHISHASKTFTVGSTNHAPVASFTYSPSNPTTADEIEFNSTSTDPDGDPISCFWKFGDGATSTSCNPTHKYPTAGTYTVELNVADPSGAYDVATQSITVSNPSADTTPPSVTLDGVPTAWQNTDATISVVCNDSGSGCDSSSYGIYLSSSAIAACPTNYTQYTNMSSVTVNRHVWACGAAKDNAGNVGFSGVYEVLVDKNAPQISFSPAPGKVSKKEFDVAVVCADGESGCASVYMYVYSGINIFGNSCPDVGSKYAETNTLTVSFSCFSIIWGEVCIPLTVCAYAVDNAGNVSPVSEGTYVYAS